MGEWADGIDGTPGAEDLTGATVGRFFVRSRLGAGGMGEVYRADDPKLKRAVALKRLAPHLNSDPRYHGRFLKEGQRASSLNHPHIASVYDVLEDRNELFLVMEYVEGSNLRQRLKQPLNVSEFLSIGTQCAEALGAAHEKGIVHGDIKPENIMLTPGGEVKVLDFGVARQFLRSDGSPDSEAETRSLGSGAASSGGTPAYMAPEMLLGKPADGRADLFALGVVFYEMLAGHHPFWAQQGTIDRILHEEPRPLRKANPNVPGPVEQVITGLLAKNPERRYATAQDLAADLHAVQVGLKPQRLRRRRRLLTRGRWAAVLALAVVTAALALVPAPRRLFRNLFSGSIPEQKQLAILPFTVMGSDPQSKAFADGLTDTLTAKLTELTAGQSLAVIPADLVQSKGVRDIDQARQQLGVNLVLTGSLHRSGQMVRVAPVLIDAKTHRQLRADVVTASLADPFGVEDQVVNGVVGMLGIDLRPGEQTALEAHGTKEPGAYDFYLQGRGYLLDYVKQENVESAISMFQRALKLDPRYTLAHAALGEAYLHKYENTQTADWLNLASENCEKAASLNDRLAEAHTCLGHVDLETGKYEDAVERFRRAIQLEPTSDEAYVGLGSAYENLHRPPDAERTYQQAIHLRPNYWVGYNWLGAFYYGQGRYADAAEQFSKVASLVPESFAAYNNLCATLDAEGRYTEAVQACQRSVSIRPTDDAYSNTATAYFYQRRYAEAADTYRQALKLDEGDYIPWGNLGDADSWIPAKGDEAKESYRKAVTLAQERLKVNPRDSRALGYLAWYQAALGDKAAAVASAQQAVKLAPHDPELLFNVALAYNQIGDADRALSWAEQALHAGYSPANLRDTPYFGKLHANERFQRLLGHG